MPKSFTSSKGGGGLASGSAVSGGGANRVLYEDGSQNLATSANLTYGASSGQLKITSSAATDVPVNIKAAGSQSGDLLQFDSSAGSSGDLLKVKSNGQIVVPASASTAASAIHIIDNGNLTFPTGIQFDSGTNGAISFYVGGARVGAFKGAGGWIVRDTNQYSFASGADVLAGSSIDTGLSRNAAKVVKVTDGSTGAGWIQTAGESRVTGNVTNATVTPANITGLSATVAAGRTYSGQIVLYFNQSTAADGFRFDLDGGTATATDVRITGTISDSTSTRFLGMNTALATDFTDTSTSGNAEVTINFTITVNAAGTIIPRFANEAASTGTGTVYRGSYMILTDIA